MCNATITDPHLFSLQSTIQGAGAASNKTLYLQTSPEFAMKRLLAAGSGSIYQLCKAFRDDEFGTQHNPEFTMLEWYRLDFDHHALMDEVDELLQLILNSRPAQRKSYGDIFQHYLNIDPHQSTVTQLRQICQREGLIDLLELSIDDRDTWLQLLMMRIIEPNLGVNSPTFIYDFPASQAALARLSATPIPVAHRFEVYINGMELANGFHELTDANLQRKRFMHDIERRKVLSRPSVPIDEKLLSALEHGLPNCAGVALGVDRLVMFKTKAKHIKEVLSFTVENA